MNYKDARIQALEAEVKRLNEVISNLNSFGVRLASNPNIKKHVNDPVFNKPLNQVEKNY